VALQPDLLRRQRLRGRGAPASLVIIIPSTKVAVRSGTFVDTDLSDLDQEQPFQIQIRPMYYKSVLRVN
jgi:hypothetical protein